jgi:hypothetical protein
MQSSLFDNTIEGAAPPAAKQKRKAVEGDICANRHKGNKRSVEAYENNKANLTKQEGRVLEFIESQKWQGAIADEVSRSLAISGQSSSARMAELKAKGMIVETERVRETQWGNWATVCVTPEYLTAPKVVADKGSEEA